MCFPIIAFCGDASCLVGVNYNNYPGFALASASRFGVAKQALEHCFESETQKIGRFETLPAG